MARLSLFKSVLCAATLLALSAVSAEAQVVQYNGNLGFGFGDFSVGDNANNAIPPCSPKLVTSMGGATTTGSVNFVGLASVIPGPAPQAVKFFKQTANVGLDVGPCTAVQTNFGAVFTRRTQTASFVWPAATGTVSSQGGFGGPSATPFLVIPPWAAPANQLIGAIRGPNKFGGAVAMAGSANAILGINAGALGVFVGTLQVTLGVGGSGPSASPPQPAPMLTIMGITNFDRQAAAPQPAGCVPFGTCTVPGVTPGFQGQTGTSTPFPFVANGANFPWTTGRVLATDKLGDFITTRTRTGFDNRTTANGTNGTLQLVSPAVILITGLADIGLAITAEMTLNFVPEPAATTMLASGVLLLGGLYTLRQRRR
jgi:hypothetical protein